MTTATVSEREVVLCVGDTTCLDCGKIIAKREGYGPIDNGGNGLLLHSAYAKHWHEKRHYERSFVEKESDRWVEALKTVEQQLGNSTRVMHVFDREGDIAEVFDYVRQLLQTGVVVRAAHNRSLDSTSERLWAKLEAQPIQFYQEIDIPKTTIRATRTAKVAIRFGRVNLRTPYRFDSREPLPVYAVYALEVDVLRLWPERIQNV